MLRDINLPIRVKRMLAGTDTFCMTAGRPAPCGSSQETFVTCRRDRLR